MTGTWLGSGDRRRPFLGYGSNLWRFSAGCRQLRFLFLQLRTDGGRPLGGGCGSCRLVYALRRRHFPTGGAGRLLRRAEFTGHCLELVRFRFESFVATVLVLARLVLLVLRAARVFDADLLFATRLRALDEEAPFVVRFDFGFAREAEPVFFVFELVVFLDLLRATIVNLSTRKLSRTRYRSGTNTALDPCTNIALRTAS